MESWDLSTQLVVREEGIQAETLQPRGCTPGMCACVPTCVCVWGAMCGGRAHMPSGRKRGGRPEGLWVSTTHFRPRKELLRMAASLSRNQAVTLQRPKATSLGDPGFQFSSVAQSCLALWPHGLQQPPCPSPTPEACSNSCSLSWWCHPTISSSVIPFSLHLQSFPASGLFPVIQFFALGGQSTGVSASASVFPMNIRTDFL